MKTKKMKTTVVFLLRLQKSAMDEEMKPKPKREGENEKRDGQSRQMNGTNETHN